jgi:5-oxoprolinase (ATP-hydrolysing)
MQAVVVASRRNVAPHGLAGGADGAPGRQWVERGADGRVEPIPGNAGGAVLAAGDALVVETPGGGGWGTPAP